jgi:hypothetical protein
VTASARLALTCHPISAIEKTTATAAAIQAFVVEVKTIPFPNKTIGAAPIQAERHWLMTDE